MSRAFTATPNDNGTVTVTQGGSEVELDFTPEMVDDSDALTKGEKRFIRSLFPSAKAGTGGSCSL